MSRGFDPATAALETGWVLVGKDGAGRPVRLTFGETELARAYLGLTVGRHPALCEHVVDDPTVSRRHFRIGLGEQELFVEDVASLNGTFLDGALLPPFQAVPLRPGQTLEAGRLVLELAGLDDH
jgi:pSer/pThr/pTyr-binding forkhead associated (FHA) protein